jgi:hypothetical protein
MKEEDIIKVSVNVDWDKVIQILSKYLEISLPYIEDLKRMKLNKFQYYLLSTFIRISINTRSLIPLIPIFKEDRTFKLPIILILRSIVSDYLTIQYLLTFHDETDEKNTAIINEISILSKDFVKFQKDFLFEELSYLHKLQIEPWKSEEKVLERINQFHIDNPDFYKKVDHGFELYKDEYYRATTADSFFPEGKKKPINDKNKYDRLKSLNREDFGFQAYLPYKYFSQFQHPSSNMDDLVMGDPKLVDNRLILMSLDLIFVATNQILRITFNKNEFVPSIKVLQDELLMLIKNRSLDKLTVSQNKK